MSGQQVAFNEASAAGDVDPGHLHDFVGAVAGLVRQRPTLSLVNVAGVVTARDNRLFAEMQSALRHDQLALLLEAMGRCPSGYDGSEPTWPAGKVVGFECVGATLAKDLGVGLVSLPSAEQWRSERLAYEPAEQVAVGAGEALVNCYDEPSGVTRSTMDTDVAASALIAVGLGSCDLARLSGDWKNLVSDVRERAAILLDVPITALGHGSTWLDSKP